VIKRRAPIPIAAKMAGSLILHANRSPRRAFRA
jgi:hypothetical protein